VADPADCVVAGDSFAYEEVAEVLNRSSAVCRALAAAARGHHTAAGTTVDRAPHAAIVGLFNLAFVRGDVPTLMSLLDPDATWSARAVVRCEQR
jgi:hypothetical protein